MRKTTDELKVREVSKALLRAVPIKPVKDYEFILQHPFTNSPFVQGKERQVLNLLDPATNQEWIELMEERIDSMPVSAILHNLLNHPWCLTWLKHTKEYLSDKDFAEFLAYSWTMQENPNMDPAVNTDTAIQWFKKADKKHLMEPTDYIYWKTLPKRVTLYRGVSQGRKELGLSWTEDKDKADWFRRRFLQVGEEGQLLKVIVDKQHCLAYLNNRGEEEIVLDVEAIKNDIERLI